MLPEKRPPEGKKRFVVILKLRCPCCYTWWTLEFESEATKRTDIKDVYLGSFKGTPAWRMDTSKWGVHSLCGTCRAKRKAFIPNLAGPPSLAWRESDESEMWGRLKGNQGEYAALLDVRAFDGSELIDEQKSVSETILPGGSIVISRERCAKLKLDWIY